jgi:hypothetical protein
MHRALNTIEEAVFSMGPPGDYINSTEQNQNKESEWSEFSTVKKEGFIVSYCNLL